MRCGGGLFPAGLAAVAALARVAAADCNGNGVDDAVDLAPAGVGFASPRTACLEEAPLDIAAADFDGDGDRDIAVARAFGITLLSNGGDGSLLPDGEIPVGSDPTAVAAVDLDGDGDADIVTMNRSTRQADLMPLNGNVSVLLNRGEGSFLSPRNHATGPEPIDLAPADLDGDGDPDLVVANAASRDVSVFFNAGQGSLEPQVRVPIESRSQPFLFPQGIACSNTSSGAVRRRLHPARRGPRAAPTRSATRPIRSGAGRARPAGEPPVVPAGFARLAANMRPRLL